MTIVINIKIRPGKNKNRVRQRSIFPKATGSASGNPDFHRNDDDFDDDDDDDVDDDDDDA